MKIGVAGYKGRVAKLVVEELQSGRWSELELAGVSTRDLPPHDPGFFVTDKAEELFEKSDAIIDFTLPEATREHIQMAAATKTALIIGTTGLKEEDEEMMREAATKTPIIYAANMSIGVNLLLALVEQAAERLGTEWDIEIFEAHHKHKVDAPSGTALAIGRAAATGRAVTLDNVAVHARDGHTGARADGSIGFAVSRGGDVVGEHRTSFYGQGERLELNHIATDRSLFAKGALQAAQWIGGQEPGLYSMRDVLNI